jgi:hypothetical protein
VTSEHLQRENERFKIATTRLEDRQSMQKVKPGKGRALQ